MMIAQRYIPILAARVDDKLIPFWNLKSKKVESYGDEQLEYFYNNKEVQLNQEVAWDTKKSIVAESIVVNSYPKKGNKTFVEIGSEFLIKSNYDLSTSMTSMKIATLTAIEYEEYDVQFMSGRKLLANHYDKWIEEEQPITVERMYEIRTWKPIYCFSDGSKNRWSHEIALLEK